ncbi:hypothetical protein CDA63_03005 [Hymenobacter amundsenii]|uniref:Outer membrane protein beta-barrel domain-containing protein n=1 Tax=Hymenobacter amundsenii TaxID=2006685 RepID=A0A246FSL2_9BACT|nr:hypothetical protein [Hymenobacter amundsenii]OWP64744.1 hypothetical protein CDA63_03005 [Hymenobacter amundsenii]
MTFLNSVRAGGLAACLLAGCLALAPAEAHAQKYITAAGLRLGGGQYGLTVQQKILPKTTLEGLALASSRELSGTVLIERHFGILGPSLNYYLGGGAHLGSHKDDGGFGGFDAIIGAEYKVAFLPVVLSADFKPTIEINSADWARFPTAISVRYIIIKEKTSFLGGVFDGRDKKKSKNKKKDKNKGGGLFGL